MYKNVLKPISGAGFWDDIKSGFRKAERWASEFKPAGKIRKYLPGSTKIPYIGNAIEVLADLGYGKKRRRRVARK